MACKILITGGCGYIGSRVAMLMASRGYEIIIVDKITPDEKGIAFGDGIEFRKADLSVKEEADRSISGADYILHLAAGIGSLTYMHKYQADIMQTNAAIDSNVYPAAVKAGVKGIVYSSSSMVFQHPPKFPYNEEDIDKINPPTNVYGFSKLIGEYFCRAFRIQYGLNSTIIRYHNVYGPGEDSKGSEPGEIHVIPALLDKIIIKKQYPVEILGDENSTRPFVYVDDAVEATARIVEEMAKGNQNVINKDFNIGTDKSIKIKDLAKRIWMIYGDGRPFMYKTVQTNANTAIRREVDASRIRNVLGWEPKISLGEGIKRTADWIKSR